MSTPFDPTLLPPPGPSVLFHPLFHPSSPFPAPIPENIPQAFTEALSVRIAVFLDEQQCSGDKEIDADDPRSWHWIAYASVSGPGANSALHTSAARRSEHERIETRASERSTEAESKARRPSGHKLPIATIRLIPPPHRKHPKPGSVDDVGGAWPDDSTGGATGAAGHDRPTAMHDGSEPYVVLGRLATLKDYRGLGLGRLLVNTALDWASRHPDQFRVGGPLGRRVSEDAGRDPPELEGVARERASMEKGEEWKGLVFIHAQKNAQRFWEAMGFVRDEELGTWVEEGIEHDGMWRRVRVWE